MIHGIKSSPVYADLTPDETGSWHFLVVEADAASALLRLCLQRDKFDYDIFYLANAERHWVSKINQQARAAAMVFNDRAGLEKTLARKLAGAGMGTRLYVAGSEYFISRVIALALEAGMAEEAIQKKCCDTLEWSASCVHC